ncbi:hypothetical protein MCOR12_001666 [Pyricularia oryzae]|uniref:Uncharacterized protein n=1 Tax=Pyricularia oryzae TaxID=318829 RepID=A0A4P7NKQ2_PYROR|nr:hypothetical protein MCOR13_000386 [Pyricularia oryzae]KAI6598054.1 hypothetical protein MCOR06_001801 [Pyricularia oryzae]KAI6605564.1 hypothetical protein MCOR12_001666 [Pyricularia oryzae]QBZ62701.1 hypothetical protein PoMZ_11587 [Pyricularia oryzae]
MQSDWNILLTKQPAFGDTGKRAATVKQAGRDAVRVCVRSVGRCGSVHGVNSNGDGASTDTTQPRYLHLHVNLDWNGVVCLSTSADKLLRWSSSGTTLATSTKRVPSNSVPRGGENRMYNRAPSGPPAVCFVTLSPSPHCNTPSSGLRRDYPAPFQGAPDFSASPCVLSPHPSPI